MRQLIQTLQSEAQKSKQALIASTGANNALEAKLATVTADLEAIRPAKNTYVFVPNQSLIVGNGLLTLGLVGSPGNNGVVLNVNGTRRSVTSGDVIEVPVNSNRVCHVAVQSFDMFRAVLNAGCGPAP